MKLSPHFVSSISTLFDGSKRTTVILRASFGALNPKQAGTDWKSLRLACWRRGRRTDLAEECSS
jgi:hypothetical protein